MISPLAFSLLLFRKAVFFFFFFGDVQSQFLSGFQAAVRWFCHWLPFRDIPPQPPVSRPGEPGFKYRSRVEVTAAWNPQNFPFCLRWLTQSVTNKWQWQCQPRSQGSLLPVPTGRRDNLGTRLRQWATSRRKLRPMSLLRTATDFLGA